MPAPHGSHSGAPFEPCACPGVQEKHTPWPVSFWCVPAAQGVHAAAFCVAEKRPAAQRAQVWSVAFRRFPALHGAQRALPSTAVLRPAGHVLQAVALIASAKVSWPQGSHRSWPVRLVNVPGMHGRQKARRGRFW